MYICIFENTLVVNTAGCLRVYEEFERVKTYRMHVICKSCVKYSNYSVRCIFNGNI